MNGRSSITPCIFGTSNGFEIQTLTKVPLNIDSMVFAVTRSEVELSANDECVKMFRARSKSDIHTWIGVYRKAYEIGFSREGGYYGAGLWLAGITVNARIALEVLKDLADQVNRLALSDGQFKRPLSSIADDMQAPAGLGPLKESSAAYLRGGLSVEALPTAYFPQYGSPREMVDWAQTAIFGENFRALIVGPEGGFPKAPSSRLEFYSDLTEVSRKLADDDRRKIGILEEEKLALQKELAAQNRELESERAKSRELQQHVNRYKRHYDQSLQRFGSREHQADWGWRKWLVFVIGLLIGLLVGLIIALIVSGTEERSTVELCTDRCPLPGRGESLLPLRPDQNPFEDGK